VIAEGAFIEVLFPTTEKPGLPGLPHICYCLAVRPPLVLVAYTTSVPWPSNTPPPLGVRPFSQEEAIALNQRRAFPLHLNRQARMPLTTRWFPKLDAPGQGVIAVAPEQLRQELYERNLDLLRRHEQTIELLGPWPIPLRCDGHDGSGLAHTVPLPDTCISNPQRALRRRQRVEQRLAVVTAHQRIDQVLGMRHQAQHT